MMQCMVEQLNGAFSRFRRRTGERYFIWKPSSLECLEVGPVQAHDGGTLRVDQDGAVFEYESKEALILLGEYIDRTGSSQDSLAYNLGKAESHYLKHQKILRNKALPLCKRLGAWVQSPATVACNSSETWHLSEGLLRNLRTWERQMLRRMLGLRRRPHENHAQFNIRSAAMIAKWMEGSGQQFAYAIVLKLVFKSDWREQSFRLSAGEQPLKHAREYRSALWWHTVYALTRQWKRRRLELQHARAGQQRSTWENPFVAVWGIHWREQRARCNTLTEWLGLFQDFSATLCDLWQLPKPKSPQTSAPYLHSTRLPGDIPTLPDNPRELSWGSSGRRVWIQTDNKQVDGTFGDT